jgi:hypothetical protein
VESANELMLCPSSRCPWRRYGAVLWLTKCCAGPFASRGGRSVAAKLLTKDEARRIALSQKGSPRLNAAR